jgi:uncharacterized protein YprB with RNaseH-like and TPR domain
VLFQLIVRMELKDKLQRLRRERESRLKSHRVSSTWEEIDKKEGLSTKEKLQRLIQLTRDEGQQKPQAPAFEPVPREPLQFSENPFSLDMRYGRIQLSEGLDISGHILTCLSGDSVFESLDLSTALFIDLETTSLSGGAGTVPFNVGMGYYKDDQFWVGQYFLGDLAEEERMIQELAHFFREMDFQSVVTYNGKAFDIPILETRFILYRQPLLLGGLPHLDFLFPARKLWSHKYENCQLYTLARKVVGADRIEDIPSSEIPFRYFQYLHTGNFDLIEPTTTRKISYPSWV